MINTAVPIVLSSDNNYAYPMMVTISSILENKKADTKYQFYILTSKDFSLEYKEKINSIVNKYGMPEVSYINMQDEYSDISMHIAHITSATYYRLQLAGILKDIKKCLYLDVDIIVRGDLTELYETDMDDCYIAGVKAAGYYFPEEKREKTRKLLEVEELNQYVNAGVLIFNLEKIRNDNLENVFQELLKNDYPSQDQDILNKACYGGIKLLPPFYNAMNKYNFYEADSYEKEECVRLCFTKDEWMKTYENPLIIHFADKRKPWEDLTIAYSKEWWKYAGDADITKESLNRFIDKIIGGQVEEKRRHAEDLERMSELNHKLKETYEEKSELNAKLQQTYKEKSELNTKLQQTYGEKSELNAKLQQTYKEKSEINAELYRKKQEKKEIKEKLSNSRNKNNELREKNSRLKLKNKELTKRLNKIEKSVPYRIYRKLKKIFKKA